MGIDLDFNLLVSIQPRIYLTGCGGGGRSVSGLHTTGSGLHIIVPSHVTIITADTYPASHWMVTVDPDNLLETGPNAPFMGLVNTGQPPA